MERRRGYNERKNSYCNTECSFNMYENGKILFYEFCSERQNVYDVVSCLAKCTYGPTDAASGNVAMGMWQTLSIKIKSGISFKKYASKPSTATRLYNLLEMTLRTN